MRASVGAIPATNRRVVSARPRYPRRDDHAFDTEAENLPTPTTTATSTSRARREPRTDRCCILLWRRHRYCVSLQQLRSVRSRRGSPETLGASSSRWAQPASPATTWSGRATCAEFYRASSSGHRAGEQSVNSVFGDGLRCVGGTVRRLANTVSSRARRTSARRRPAPRASARCRRAAGHFWHSAPSAACSARTRRST